MSIQSLMTPATFMVRALVLPISRKTDMLSAAGSRQRVRLMKTARVIYRMWAALLQHCIHAKECFCCM